VSPRRRALAAATALIAIVSGAHVARADEIAELVSRRIGALRAGHEVRVGRDRIASTRALPDLYERAGFRLLWARVGAARGLLAAVRDADAHGLDPDDYHRPEIERLLAVPPRDAAAQVDFDLLLTDAMVRLAYHLVYGKVDAQRLDPHWNLSREIDGESALETLLAVPEAPWIPDALAAFAPSHRAYHRFQGALARYRALAASGGFPLVPAGPKLELGSEGPRVLALRRRLVVEGDLAEGAVDSPLFDVELERAVKRAQRRYRIERDGVVGPVTLAALNVSAQARVDQIRVNLERARWVLHALRGRLVLIDVAGFHLHYIDGELDWSTRVVVGRPYRKTPIFRAEIRELLLNPTWTVPPTILRNDVIPDVRKDRGYLARKHMRVLDAQGREVDPRRVDWASAAAGRFPYRIRQDAGPGNSLGRIKFVMPNPYTVYLHDTPAVELFERAERAASSGCIRVEHPLVLASLLLGDRESWSVPALEAEIAKGETRTVKLPEPVPVIVMYWTVDADADGSVYFQKDLYERDPAVLRALDADFSFRESVAGGRR
jgi:murein L,D-transpeptidase YcbB/YkuD